jgi:hypothetical protein
MALQDYSQDDDFFKQGFERKGAVSVWLGTEPAPRQAGVDTLQDLCGVGYYQLSDQESDNSTTPVAIARLFEDVSYAGSFLPAIVEAARRQNITSAYWMTAQFDFAYDKARVRRPVADQPVFIGVFPYSTAT